MFSPSELASIWSACCKQVNGNIICYNDSWEKYLRQFLFRRLVDVIGTVCNLWWLMICGVIFNPKKINENKKKKQLFPTLHTEWTLRLDGLFTKLKFAIFHFLSRT